MRFLFLIFCPLIYLNKYATAQQSSLGSWNIFNIKQNINQKSSLFFEAQLRSLLFYDHFHYHEFKVGYQYQWFPNFRIGIGGGKYDTYREGGDFKRPMNSSEIRIWPQFIFIDEVGKIMVEQRYRVEARFLESGYRNRFRYRLGVLFALTNNKKLQYTASNELFFF
jgi:hypothetical protein